MWGVCNLLQSPYSGLGFQMKSDPWRHSACPPSADGSVFQPRSFKMFSDKQSIITSSIFNVISQYLNFYKSKTDNVL